MVKITIKYGKFLDPIFTAWVKGTHKNWKAPTKRVILNRVAKYQKVWKKHGKRILKALEATSGMEFRRTEIPVYIVSGNPRAFSDPIVLTSRYTENVFLDILTHELIHCLFVDNQIPVKAVHKIFPHKNEITSAHIPVYAILMSTFKGNDFSKKYKVVKNSVVNVHYLNAIKVVKEQGYENITKVIKNELTKHIDTL